MVHNRRVGFKGAAMKKALQSKPLSYLETHAAALVEELSVSRQPTILTINGEAKLVVMDFDSYERKEETIALLKLLALGNRDIESGRYRDADEVFAALDKDDLFSCQAPSMT
jgi:PHD/YefM family antitoxin component YafN of YafNO toxin-antitoxin module